MAGAAISRLPGAPGDDLELTASWSRRASLGPRLHRARDRRDPGGEPGRVEVHPRLEVDAANHGPGVGDGSIDRRPAMAHRDRPRRAWRRGPGHGRPRHKGRRGLAGRPGQNQAAVGQRCIRLLQLSPCRPRSDRRSSSRCCVGAFVHDHARAGGCSASFGAGTAQAPRGRAAVSCSWAGSTSGSRSPSLISGAVVLTLPRLTRSS